MGHWCWSNYRTKLSFCLISKSRFCLFLGSEIPFYFETEILIIFWKLLFCFSSKVRFCFFFVFFSKVRFYFISNLGVFFESEILFCLFVCFFLFSFFRKWSCVISKIRFWVFFQNWESFLFRKSHSSFFSKVRFYFNTKLR